MENSFSLLVARSYADEVRVSLIWELRTLETSKHIHEILEIAP